MLRFVTILFLIGFACGAPKKSVINDPQLVKMLESIPGEGSLIQIVNIC